jgi:hypothetical protein
VESLWSPSSKPKLVRLVRRLAFILPVWRSGGKSVNHSGAPIIATSFKRSNQFRMKPQRNSQQGIRLSRPAYNAFA